MLLWEILIVVVVLKIPIAYVGGVLWWSVKAEPEAGAQGGTEGLDWMPWRRRPSRPRHPERGRELGRAQRRAMRAERGRERSRAA